MDEFELLESSFVLASTPVAGVGVVPEPTGGTVEAPELRFQAPRPLDAGAGDGVADPGAACHQESSQYDHGWTKKTWGTTP